MAFLLPENIPTRNGIPVRMRTTAKYLREFLPEEVTVWLAPTELAVARKGRVGSGDVEVTPYLIVLDPRVGILLLETPAVHSRAKSHKWLQHNPNSVDFQTELSMHISKLRIALDLRALEHLPLESALAFPDRDRDTLSRFTAPDRDLRLLDSEAFATAETLNASIASLFGSNNTGCRDKRDEAVARTAVNPEIILPSKGDETSALFSDPQISPDDVIPVMNREQERVAEHLGEGYRVLRGVAGSGKTLVLVHRARFLARLFPKWRILILCYNRILAFGLEHMVKDVRGITVRNIDRLAYEIVNRRTQAMSDQRPIVSAKPNRPKIDFDERRLFAVEVAKALPDIELFDVVLVDEAQDFSYIGMDLAYAMLKPGRTDFVMALDSAQNIYRSRGMMWNPPGMTARGRTKLFRDNYRNTLEILQDAMNLLATKSEWEHDESSLEENPERLSKPNPPKRRGPVPKVLTCKDLRHEALTITSRVRSLILGGVKPDNITIMYGSEEFQRELNSAFRRSFGSQNMPYFWLQQKTRYGWKVNQDRAFKVRNVVRVSTLYGLKGLEFSRVFIGGVNTVHIPNVKDEEQLNAAKKLLYVGMTRAQDELTITMSGEGPIGAALQDAKAGNL